MWHALLYDMLWFFAESEESARALFEGIAVVTDAINQSDRIRLEY